MRVATLAALAAMSAIVLALTGPADAQQRNGYRAQGERITIIDENGRVRTKITVRPRSYLDGGTEVLPGDRKFMDYAFPPAIGYPSFGRENNNRPIDRQPLNPPSDMGGYPERIPLPY